LISEELKNDKDFISKLVNNNGYWSFSVASDEIKNDREFILQLLSTEKTCFKLLSNELNAKMVMGCK